jgi:YegS/Rv2252/BmrU family lipid kinase
VDRDVALLCNPSAGGGRADDARALAQTAAAAGEVAVTLGGDGLAGCVAGALRDVPGALLGVLPGGRGNDLVRALKIPLDARAACAIIAAGHERALDLGDVDGRTFVGIASLGFDSDANRIANAAPSRLGSLVYVYGALRALAAWKPASFDLQLDGEPLSFSGYSVAAANTPGYGGGMLLAPTAELADGLLDVVLAGDLSKRRFLLVLPKVFKGKHVSEPTYRMVRAREVQIDADRPFVLYADGDPIGETPVTIRIVPDALRVLAPA